MDTNATVVSQAHCCSSSNENTKDYFYNKIFVDLQAEGTCLISKNWFETKRNAQKRISKKETNLDWFLLFKRHAAAAIDGEV
eukprot:IDg5581t1